MRRSEINTILRNTEAFLRENRFHLPPFATWSPADWQAKGAEAAEIVDNQLGWDITDFGTGDFDQCGLSLFTLRNGSPDNARTGTGKTYCEKVAMMRQGQACPHHHHFVKVEDIINRGEAPLAVTLHNSADDGSFADTPVTVSLDGVVHTLPAGAEVRLSPGESVTLVPGCYHALTAPEGDVLFGEVSVVNDDHADNRFHTPVGRFPAIEEDEPPLYLLVQDYGRYWRG